jgi:hypothetical protein
LAKWTCQTIFPIALGPAVPVVAVEGVAIVPVQKMTVVVLIPGSDVETDETGTGRKFSPRYLMYTHTTCIYSKTSFLHVHGPQYLLVYGREEKVGQRAGIIKQ